jgi:hypothetical protein
VDEARDNDLGRFINRGSASLDTLRDRADDITRGAAKVSGGVADVGVSAFGVVTLAISGHVPSTRVILAIEAVTAVNYMLGFRRRRSSAATASGASATPPTVPAIVSDG